MTDPSVILGSMIISLILFCVILFTIEHSSKSNPIAEVKDKIIPVGTYRILPDIHNDNHSYRVQRYCNYYGSETIFYWPDVVEPFDTMTEATIYLDSLIATERLKKEKEIARLQWLKDNPPVIYNKGEL